MEITEIKPTKQIDNISPTPIGFEPILTDLESAVLPFNDGGKIPCPKARNQVCAIVFLPPKVKTTINE